MTEQELYKYGKVIDQVDRIIAELMRLRATMQDELLREQDAAR